MSWAGPEDIYLSTSLASYLDSKLLLFILKIIVLYFYYYYVLICMLFEFLVLKLAHAL
ncbi:hypothetical protein HanPI659440_Chr04g0139521 [Helianthus annuus]|nr:hypothetical protein HanPI659440_Chr04g0139521 [Helianthus annuus]